MTVGINTKRYYKMQYDKYKQITRKVERVIDNAHINARLDQ